MDRAVAGAASFPEADRRAAARRRPSELPFTIGCRITPGHDVGIVDISAAGMLVASSSPLFPRRIATLVLTCGERRVVLSGTVVRSCLSAIEAGRGATFEAGIAFEHSIDTLRELLAAAVDDRVLQRDEGV